MTHVEIIQLRKTQKLFSSSSEDAGSDGSSVFAYVAEQDKNYTNDVEPGRKTQSQCCQASFSLVITA